MLSISRSKFPLPKGLAASYSVLAPAPLSFQGLKPKLHAGSNSTVKAVPFQPLFLKQIVLNRCAGMNK